MDAAPQNHAWLGTSEADGRLRSKLAETMNKSKKNRAVIASEMTRQLGRPVTANMLHDFSRSAAEQRDGRRRRDVRFPLAWLRAFSIAVGSDELERWAVGPELLEKIELGERQHLKFDWALQRLERLYSKVHKVKAAGPQKSERKERTSNRAR